MSLKGGMSKNGKPYPTGPFEADSLSQRRSFVIHRPSAGPASRGTWLHEGLFQSTMNAIGGMAACVVDSTWSFSGIIRCACVDLCPRTWYARVAIRPACGFPGIRTTLASSHWPSLGLTPLWMSTDSIGKFRGRTRVRVEHTTLPRRTLYMRAIRYHQILRSLHHHFYHSS